MKSSAPLFAHRLSILFLATSLLFVSGCSEERKLSNKAQWLCAYDQLHHIDPHGIPEGAELGDYLHPLELEYLRQWRLQDDADVNEDAHRWAELSQQARQYMIAARAENTRCVVRNIHLFDEQDVAFVELTSNMPDVDLSLTEIEEATKEELTDRFAQIPHSRTTHTLVFLRTDDGWRAEGGLKDRFIQWELETLDERKNQILEQLPGARQAAEEEQQLHSLTIFRVESASLNITDRRQRRGDLEAEISIRGTNRFDESIGRIEFEVTYRAPGQEPKKGEFFFDGRDFSAGESRTIQLQAANPRAPFGDEIVLDDKASINVSIRRIFDSRNNLLAETGGIDPRRARESLQFAAHSAEGLERELDEIDRRREELHDKFTRWHQERFPEVDGHRLGIDDLDIHIDAPEL